MKETRISGGGEEDGFCLCYNNNIFIYTWTGIERGEGRTHYMGFGG